MKNSGLLIAFGLIGYGLWKFTQSGSKSSGLGSPFRSSGTARVPSVFGAAKPGGAPVFTTAPGPGPARSPVGGASSIDLGAAADVAKAAAKAAADALRKWFAGSDEPPDFTDTLDFSDDPVFEFNDDLDFGDSLSGANDFNVDPSIYEGQA